MKIVLKEVDKHLFKVKSENQPKPFVSTLPNFNHFKN